tara:strand:- start:165 stop:272 length:108 start_codon:yes stop_codon:yes gene_type:complete
VARLKQWSGVTAQRRDGTLMLDIAPTPPNMTLRAR